MLISFRGRDTESVAASRLQAVVGKHQIDAAEHRSFLAALVHGEGNPFDHCGKALDRDGILRKRHFDLREAVAPQDRDLVEGSVALHRKLQRRVIAGKRDRLATQTLQHSHEELRVDDDGVLALTDTGDTDADRDLKIGGDEAQMSVAPGLQKNALEHLQRG